MVGSASDSVWTKHGTKASAIDDLAAMFSEGLSALAKEFSTTPSHGRLFQVVGGGGVWVKADRRKGLSYRVSRVANPVPQNTGILDGVWNQLGCTLVKLSGDLCPRVNARNVRGGRVYGRFCDSAKVVECATHAFKQRRVFGRINMLWAVRGALFDAVGKGLKRLGFSLLHPAGQRKVWGWSL
jgi:hypothetical protein